MTGDQIPLFFESYEEAIRHTVNALGGPKAVGHKLWPSMEPDEAGRKLSACLNTDKREKLSPHELKLIRTVARQAGVHTLKAYENREEGYADPMPLSPEDEAAQLQREYIQATRDMSAIARRIEQLGLARRSS